MFSSLRTRFGIPGVISVVALVFAMFGGAYAASNSGGGSGATASKAKQGKQGKQGKPGKPGPAGPQGPAGPAGAKGDTGATGQNGTNGTNGSNGADGKTVLNGATAPAAGLGTVGDFYIRTTTQEIYGPKTAGGWGSPTPLKGEDGETGFTETLPSEETETGTWMLAPEAKVATMPFSIPLEDPLPGAQVEYVTAPTVNCPGTPATPEAEPGYFCVYQQRAQPDLPGFPATFLGDPSTGTTVPLAGAGRAGAVLWAPAYTGSAFGTWAVTAE